MSAIDYVSRDSRLTVVCHDDLASPAVAFEFRDLIPEFSIRTFRSPHDWTRPAMVAGSSQAISLKVNLAFLSAHPSFNAGKLDHQVQLALYTKQFNTFEITPFDQFTQKQVGETVVSDQILSYDCRFRIEPGFSSIKRRNLYSIALQIDRLRIYYLAEDIFVASNQKQLKGRFLVGDQVRMCLRESTFWFRKMESEEKESRKRDFSQISSSIEKTKDEEEIVKRPFQLASMPDSGADQQASPVDALPYTFDDWGWSAPPEDFPEDFFRDFDYQEGAGIQ